MIRNEHQNVLGVVRGSAKSLSVVLRDQIALSLDSQSLDGVGIVIFTEVRSSSRSTPQSACSLHSYEKLLFEASCVFDRHASNLSDQSWGR